MTDLLLPSGQKVAYDYDPAADSLRIVLDPPRGATAISQHPDRPRVKVEQEVDSGRLVAIEVTQVQSWLHGELVTRLVSEVVADIGPLASATIEETPPEEQEAPGASSEEGDAPAEAPSASDESGSFAAFDLDGRLLAAVAALGLTTPTAVQRRAIPALIEGKDVVGLSQTGSGKTLAFLLPALSKMLARPSASHAPRLLVVTPTRELAQQVAAAAESLVSSTDLRVTTIFGGRDMRRQTQALRSGTDVIVATPGRLLDHIDRGNAKLATVEVLVLDEADRMLDMGFIDDIRDIVRCVPSERQTLMFGATMPAEIELLSVDFQRSPTVIEVARRKPPESIQQVLFPVGRHLKSLLLIHLLESDPSLTTVMVFVDTKRESDVLARQLREAGIPAALMHGDRSQKDREKALRFLRERKVRVLVATNVAARGLDIEDVSHVVNYDVPRTVDEYVHRIGRTARADARGSAFTLVGPGDEAMVMRIESALETTLPRRFADGFDYDVPTPSWAKPSARDVSASLTKARNAADVSRRTRFKR